MDLVAVLTVDGQLLVHRTLSWQKLLHVKPTEVAFEITTVEWSPDGLCLALGCDEGEVVVYEIESGEARPELRGLKRLDAFQHHHAIAAMHWVQQQLIDASEADNGAAAQYFNHRAVRCVPTAPSDIQSKKQSSSSPTVLATADANNSIVLWWMGKVYMTKIDVSARVHELGGLTNSTFTIDAVRLAPDLSRLFVMLVVTSTDNAESSQAQTSITDGSHTESSSNNKLHQLVTFNLSSLHRIRDELELVASVADESYAVMNQLWKNAMRIFELKMGLMGSLYEKYGCEDPPQVDMLSVVASGITSPALAQYFAQDIQEMTLSSLVEDKMKAGLVHLLFQLSEFRGRAKWKRNAYSGVLGLSIPQIDELVLLAQDLLISMEVLAQAIHETRQDFVLFFQWILERIRVHTNTSTGRGGSSTVSSNVNGDSGTKSLLNQRRLCSFLRRAAETAQGFRIKQPPSNKHRVEPTFGNLVSKQLSKPKSVEDPNGSVSSTVLLEKLEAKWFELMQRMTESIAKSVVVDTAGCFNIGEQVAEFNFHYRERSPRSGHGSDKGDTDEQSDDDEEEGSEDEGGLEAVDWNSLKHFALAQKSQDADSMMMLGIRRHDNEFLLLQANWNRRLDDLLQSSLTWEAIRMVTSTDDCPSDTQVLLQGFYFYGDKASGKDEQLAFYVRKSHVENGAEQEQDWLYLRPYDHIAPSPLKISPKKSSVNTLEVSGISIWSLFTGKHRARFLATLSSPRAAPPLLPRVIANASRGILCVSTLPNRLIILDAEDNNDDEEDEEEDPESESEHLNGGHESDSNEVEL
ncbi:Anaphase-promoting complex component cut20/apc4, partial [Globisporangium splendens]